jgi:hypothetical protein
MVGKWIDREGESANHDLILFFAQDPIKDFVHEPCVMLLV